MFKRRFSFKNIIPNVKNLNSLRARKCSNASEAPQIKLEKVLMVSKLCFYEHERNKYSNLSEDRFAETIKDRGSDYDKMLHFFHKQKLFEGNVINHLKEAGAQVKIVNRLNYKEKYVKWADVVVPTGGDGTFLLAASKIRNSNVPVVGFNSDPSRSEGYLCLPREYSTNISEAIRKLKEGNFKWLLRNRIQTTLYGHNSTIVPIHLHATEKSMSYFDEHIHQDGDCNKGQILPFLALNEVFIGECMSARVSYLEMWLNGSDQETNMKCSGLCVTTGTGSTSWHMSINRLPVQIVAELLRLLDIHATGEKNSLATVLADMYNKNLIFQPEDKRLGYTIRDLISAGVWPQPKGIKSRGFASKIKVKSKCTDACLVIDGGIAIPFNDGSRAVLEIKPENSLRTIVFSD